MRDMGGRGVGSDETCGIVGAVAAWIGGMSACGPARPAVRRVLVSGRSSLGLGMPGRGWAWTGRGWRGRWIG